MGNPTAAADIIRRSREWANLSQRELAERAGTSGPAISFYESGDRIPRVDTLQRIVDAAGIELTIGIELDDAEPIDLQANARSLLSVLDLADALPKDWTRDLEYPILRDAAR